jgi:hypothetical protein
LICLGRFGWNLGELQEYRKHHGIAVATHVYKLTQLGIWVEDNRYNLFRD